MTPLGLLNFVVLQWFGVRLEATIDTDLTIDVVTGEFPLDQRGRWWSRYAPRDGRVTWSLIRWVWPLTGWWSDYRWIARRT